jgi:hypothetical protein
VSSVLPSLLDAALEYAARGWPVFPLHGIRGGTCTCGKPTCGSRGKHPRTEHGKDDATTDVTRIRAWWQRWPDANVGGLTGEASGVIALDVDPPEGEDSLAGLLNGRSLPPTPISITGRGRHFLLAHAGRSIANRAGLLPGLDVRGDGGYIVLPPSIHESGTAYVWQDGSEHLAPAPMPTWLLELFRKPSPTPRTNATGQGLSSVGDAYAETALSRELDAVARAPVGTRNDTLNRAAFNLGQLVAGGCIGRGPVEAALLAAAEDSGLVRDDGEKAARDTIRSGLQGGVRRPRGPREQPRPPRLGEGDAPPAEPEPAPGKACEPRPTIIVRDELGVVTAEAVDALSRDRGAGIFVRGRTLVRVVRAEGRVRRGLRRPLGAPVIEPLTLDALRSHLDRAAEWVRTTARGTQSALPPEWVARAVLSLDVQPFRPLAGVVEAPTMRPDGTVLCRRGYDASTGLLLRPATCFPPVSAMPSPAEVSAAVEMLLEPFRDFPIVDESGRAAVIAAVLSIVARAAIEGPAPMFAMRAPTPGTGKSLLADVVAVLGTARPAARMAMPGDDDEVRKLVLAVAFEGTPLVALDNIDRPLGSHTLAAALTADEWTGRRLGSTAMVTAPLRAVWLATGNGLTFRGDLARRVVPVDLDAELEHPEDRTTFKHPDLLCWVRGHRPGLVVAALTVLRGFHLAGRPAHGCGAPMGSFERWDGLIRGATVWAELGDPLGGRERVRAEDDGDAAALGAALEMWLQTLRNAPKTAAEALGEAENRAANGEPALREALLGLTPQRDRPNATALGYALRRVKGRVIRGRSFEAADKRHSTTLWTVKVRGGDGEMGDMFPSNAGEKIENSEEGWPETSPPSPSSPPAGGGAR